VPSLAQLVQPLANNPFQGTLAPGEQGHADLPMVATATGAADMAAQRETIDQTHGAVRLEKQALREPTDTGLISVREAAHGEEHLVLLRFEASGFGGFITAVKKLAYAMAQFGQCGIFGITDLSSHILSLSPHDIHASLNIQHPLWIRQHPLVKACTVCRSTIYLFCCEAGIENARGGHKRMRETPRTCYRTFFLVIVAIAALGLGCRHKPTTAPTPPPAPVPSPAKPAVSLQAAPGSIQKGDTATLTWSSTNATELKLTPGIGTVAAAGSTKVAPVESTTYTITAAGPGGSADASASVTVVRPPPPPAPRQPRFDELFAEEVRDAYFDYNKADINSDAREALTKTADFLRKYPEVKVTVEGHCDERGSTEYNLALGDRRAQAVRQYLISLGISAGRMNAVSYGKEKPFCSQQTEDCWQSNRRGHFIMAQ